MAHSTEQQLSSLSGSLCHFCRRDAPSGKQFVACDIDGHKKISSTTASGLEMVWQGLDRSTGSLKITEASLTNEPKVFYKQGFSFNNLVNCALKSDGLLLEIEAAK